MGERKRIIHDTSEIPRFKTEEEGDALWSTHRLSRELLTKGAPPSPERVMGLLRPLREAHRREEEARRRHAAG